MPWSRLCESAQLISPGAIAGAALLLQLSKDSSLPAPARAHLDSSFWMIWSYRMALNALASLVNSWLSYESWLSYNGKFELFLILDAMVLIGFVLLGLYLRSQRRRTRQQREESTDQ